MLIPTSLFKHSGQRRFCHVQRCYSRLSRQELLVCRSCHDDMQTDQASASKTVPREPWEIYTVHIGLMGLDTDVFQRRLETWS